MKNSDFLPFIGDIMLWGGGGGGGGEGSGEGGGGRGGGGGSGSAANLTIQTRDMQFVRDFAFVFFVSWVSCYFGTRETRETIGTGARTDII